MALEPAPALASVDGRRRDGPPLSRTSSVPSLRSNTQKNQSQRRYMVLVAALLVLFAWAGGGTLIEASTGSSGVGVTEVSNQGAARAGPGLAGAGRILRP